MFISLSYKLYVYKLYVYENKETCMYLLYI